MRILIALGGNAMTGPGGDASQGAQITAIAEAMRAVAGLIVAGHEVVITHGNGPQVGNLLVQNEIAATIVPPETLDWCGAETQATVGFVIMSTLEQSLRDRGCERPVAAVVTRTLVDGHDRGFDDPSKPIGRFLSRADAEPLIAHGQVWRDLGDKGWRRVVASPEPVEVLEMPALLTLIDAGFVVVAAGGGGIPVTRDGDGVVRGVEAVIDKDLTAALLARAIRADVLMIATDVAHASTAFGCKDEEAIGTVAPDALRVLAQRGEFGRGSMAPKVEAAVRFVEGGGARAVISDLAHIEDAVTGDHGTIVQAQRTAPQPD